jgi:hypothetical protein
MNEHGSPRHRVLRGTIRRRLLVNAVVDPDEAATRLPPGVRPHVAGSGTVVGCCLLDVEHVRPADLPASAGRTLRAAAHRISVDWEDCSGATVTGVYVPLRHSDSRAAIVLGGRWFPGVHERARVAVSASDRHVRWVSHPVGAADRLGIRVAVSVPVAESPEDDDPVGRTCLSALVGLSPDHRGVLEAARMEPVRRDATAVTVEILDSAFLDGFSTARAATSYLMRDVDVSWTPAGVPAAALTITAS